MACCEYRNKDDSEISKPIAEVLLIFFSFFLFCGLILFGTIGLISERCAEIGDYFRWSLMSLSDSPNLFLTEWKVELSGKLFSFSPYFAGLVYRKLTISLLFLINFIICFILVKFVQVLI